MAIAVALSCLIAWCPLLEFLQTFSVILCAVAASAVMAWLAPIEEVEE